MRFVFTEKDPQKILETITSELGGRELGKLLNLELNASELVVTISKLGTSVLRFAQKKLSDGVEFALTEEKIAFTHRAFKDDMTAKLAKLVEKSGGKVFQK